MEHLISYKLDGKTFYIVPNVNKHECIFACVEIGDHLDNSDPLQKPNAFYVSQDYFLRYCMRKGLDRGAKIYSDFISKYISATIDMSEFRTETNPYTRKQEFSNRNRSIMSVFYCDYHKNVLSDKQIFVEKSGKYWPNSSASVNFMQSTTGTYFGPKMLFGTTPCFIGDLIEISFGKGRFKILFSLFNVKADWEDIRSEVCSVCQVHEFWSIEYLSVNMPEFDKILFL